MEVKEIKKRVIVLDEEDKEVLDKAYSLLESIDHELYPNHDYTFEIPRWDEEVLHNRLREISYYVNELMRELE